MSTIDGLKAVDPEMVRLMQTFGASRSRIFREVRIPVVAECEVTHGVVFAKCKRLGNALAVTQDRDEAGEVERVTIVDSTRRRTHLGLV